MKLNPLFALLATVVMAACSTEPVREQAGGSPAPGQGTGDPAAAAQLQAPDAPGGPDTPVSDGPAVVPAGAERQAEPARPASGGSAGQPGSPAGSGAQPGAAPVAAPAPQQPSDEGADVLRRASAAYENVRSLRADFVMNFENPLLRQSTTSRGTIYQRQPDRIALRFSDPDGDVILSDGAHFWVYYPSVNAQQVIRSPASAGGESGVNLQAQFVGNPVERFQYELHGTEAVGGRTAHVLTLVPRQRAEYRSLKVWIDARDGLARRFEITEHNGSVRRFDLQNMQVNPTIQESVFRFTPPAGARVIDAG
jgi:outer membrane lipoprotein carrier protein